MIKITNLLLQFFNTHLWSKSVASAPLLLLLLVSACQTPVELAGTKHKSSVEKWQALSDYAESTLTQESIYITAKLTVDATSSREFYQIADIKLSDTETPFEINLLNPVFEHKYICTPVCSNLIEYVQFDDTSGKTLLDRYFIKHKFELFDFYSMLYQLNPKLTKVKNISPKRFPAYLSYLVQRKETFESLALFSNYLKNALSIKQYQRYLDGQLNSVRPNPKTSHDETSLWQSARLQDAAELNTNYNGLPETKSWAINTPPAESLHWSTITISPVASTQKSIAQNITNETDDNEHDNSEEHSAQNPPLLWQEAIKATLTVGDNACSYSDNMFGTVIEITKHNVLLDIKGQAKTILDGVINNAKEGHLFSANEETFFKPMSNLKKSYKRVYVAACEIRFGPEE